MLRVAMIFVVASGHLQGVLRVGFPPVGKEITIQPIPRRVSLVKYILQLSPLMVRKPINKTKDECNSLLNAHVFLIRNGDINFKSFSDKILLMVQKSQTTTWDV